MLSVAELLQPLAAHEFTGLPIVVLIDDAMPAPAAAVAFATSAALNEYAGGTPVPAAGGIVHCASVRPHTLLLPPPAVRSSVAVACLPVSCEPTNR